MDDLLSEFVVESTESIYLLDNELLELEKDPNNQEILKSIFRILHTIKGTCGFIGLSRLEKVAHAGEAVLVKLRDGKIFATPQIVTLILECIDVVKYILEAIPDNDSEPEGEDGNLIKRLLAAADGEGVEISHARENPAADPDAVKEENPIAENNQVDNCDPLTAKSGNAASEADDHFFDDDFDLGTPPNAVIDSSLESSVESSSDLAQEFSLESSLASSPQSLESSLESSFASSMESSPESLSETNIPREADGTPNLFDESVSDDDIFSFYAQKNKEQANEVGLDTVDKNELVTESQSWESRRGENRAEENQLNENEVGQSPADQSLKTDKQREKVAENPAEKPIERAAEKPIERAAEKPIEKAADKPIEKAADKPIEKQVDKPIEMPADKPIEKPIGKAADKPKSGTSTDVTNANIRVSVKLLENLMSQVSELVLTRNQIIQTFKDIETKEIRTCLHRLNQITSELQEGITKTRMQPISNAWTKLPRLVRDLAIDTGKKVELIMIGEDTELDRQVIEMIKDPLTHMLRNSVDHGLEKPDVRRDAGKSESGTIILKAYHEGGIIIIEVSDDGRGLSIDRIKEKAVTNELTTAKVVETLSDNQIYQFIFKSGFSTAEVVTNVSGRGVGMDVVRSNIEKINGLIDVQSFPGKGTLFTIKIPLTLAIVSALIVEAEGHRFAIPQLNIQELIKVSETTESSIEYVSDKPLLRLRDQLIPLVHLRSLLNLDHTPSANESMSNGTAPDQPLPLTFLKRLHR